MCIVQRLARECDILVESFPAGYLDQLGLGYAALERLHPGLIYTSVTPFGQTGPYRDYKGSELVAQAMGALMHTIGLPDREPLRIGGNAASYHGHECLSATLLALYVRDAAGHGQHVDVSAMETITVAQIHASIAHQFGRTPTRRASTLAQAQDGWVHAGLERGVREDTWARVCALMGRPELADDPKFNTREARREHRQELLTLINEWTATRPKEEIYHTLQGLRTVAGYVATVAVPPHSNCWRGHFSVVLTIRTLVQQPILAHPLRSKAPPGTRSGRRAWVSTMWRCTATASVTPERTWRSCVVLVSSKEQGESMTQFALEGLRILDLTQVAVGPYATLLLGFMGAEVIKVESCSRMDISRGAAQPPPRARGSILGVNLVSVRGTAPPITCTAMATSAVSPWTWRRRVARPSSCSSPPSVMCSSRIFAPPSWTGWGWAMRPWRTPTPD